MIHVAILLLEISNFVTLILPENLRSNYNNNSVFIDVGFKLVCKPIIKLFMLKIYMREGGTNYMIYA